MVFVQVPAGRFWMGGLPPVEMLAQTYPQLEKKRFTDLVDEAPAHGAYAQAGADRAQPDDQSACNRDEAGVGHVAYLLK